MLRGHLLPWRGQNRIDSRSGQRHENLRGGAELRMQKLASDGTRSHDARTQHSNEHNFLALALATERMITDKNLCKLQQTEIRKLLLQR